MSTIHQDIRAALQTAAIAVAGFPPANQRAFDGNLFASTPRVPWVRLIFMPSMRRPLSLAGSKLINGLFQVSLFYPPNKGSADVEAMADKVIDAFPAFPPLQSGAARVRITAAYRGPLIPEADTLQCPVTVAWQCIQG